MSTRGDIIVCKKMPKKAFIIISESFRIIYTKAGYYINVPKKGTTSTLY